MIDLKLIAVVSAMNTVESIDYLPLAEKNKRINRLIEKLQPLAEEGYDPACYFLGLHHPDSASRLEWLEKSAALGNITAMQKLFYVYLEMKAPAHQIFSALVRYVKLENNVLGKPAEISASQIRLLKKHGLGSDKHVQMREEMLAAYTVTQDQIETAHYHIDHQTIFRVRSADDHGFLVAVHANDLERVKKYITQGVNPFVHEFTATGAALHEAVRIAAVRKRFEMLAFFIKLHQQYHFDLNYTVEGSRMPPIYAAAHFRSNRAIEMLVEAGVEMSFVLWNCYSIHNREVTRRKIEFINSIIKDEAHQLTFTVLPIIRESDGISVIESYNEVFDDANGGLSRFELVTNQISNREEHSIASERKLTYQIIDYDIPHENGLFVLDLQTNETSFFIEEQKVHSNRFARFINQEISSLLKANNISFSKESKFSNASTNYTLTMARENLPLVVDFLLAFHERHVFAVSANRLMSDTPFLKALNPSFQTRVKGMLQMDTPSKRNMPMLFDYDYTVLMKSFATEEEKRVYRNYCTIRFLARFFASAFMSQQIILPREFLLDILSLVSNHKIHNKDESRKIAKDNFQRLPATTYTPRFFLPAALTNPLPENTPSLKPS